MKAQGCPVCGNPDVTVLDEYGCTTFEICRCCNCEAGYEYDANTGADRLLELRRQWLDSETKEKLWLYGRPVEAIDKAKLHRAKENQLRKAGLEVPN